jgi:hypothetical protein
MIQIKTLCDECGEIATYSVIQMTGRVLIDGKDGGQDADFCDEHRPGPNEHQPRNCKRVRFYWSGMPEWNTKD